MEGGHRVSELARRNGWRGFENAGAVEKVEGGYEYVCDGMPTMMGCGSRVTVQRKWTTVGKKKDGWIVEYGLDGPSDAPFEEYTDIDEDVVLVFCPRCQVTMKKAKERA